MLDETNKPLVKNLIIIGVFILAMGFIIGGTYVGWTKYQEYKTEQIQLKKEAAHKAAQASIREMITFCGFANVKDEEQASIDKCGDDVDAAKAAILHIIDDRIVYWQVQMADANERMGKLLSIKQGANYWSDANEMQFKTVGQKILKDYEAAEVQLKFWKTKKSDLSLGKNLSEKKSDKKVSV